MKNYCFLLIFVIFFSQVVFSQTNNSNTNSAEPYTPNEFPLWQKELRRTEIITFGSLPFVTFFYSIFYDTYRYFDHNKSEAYLPWPLKKQSIAVPLTEQEQKDIFFNSLKISLGFALFDYSLHLVKRHIINSKNEKSNKSEDTVIQVIPKTQNINEAEGDL